MDVGITVRTAAFMPHTYILLTAKGSYYVGSTDRLEERLAAHRKGEVKTTKSALPIELVYSEYFPTRGEAQKKEYQIKRWKSRRLIESLIRKSKISILGFAAPSSNG